MPRSPATVIRTLRDTIDTINIGWQTLTDGYLWEFDADDAADALRTAAVGGPLPDRDALAGFMRHITRLRSTDPAIEAHLSLTLPDQATVACWSTHQVVYLLDPDLWTAFADTAPDGVIPAEVFTRIPHPNPYVAFADPIPIRTDTRSDRLVLDGFFVTGYRLHTPTGLPVPVPTTDPDLDGLALLFTGGQVDPVTGRRVTTRITTARGGERTLLDQTVQRSTFAAVDRTLGEHVDVTRHLTRTATNVQRAADLTGLLDEADLDDVIRTAVIAVVYLCSDAPDLARLPADSTRTRPPRKRRGRDTGPTVDVHTVDVHTVGSRVGAALRAHRTDPARADAAHTDSTAVTGPAPARFDPARPHPGQRWRTVTWRPPGTPDHGTTDPDPGDGSGPGDGPPSVPPATPPGD